MRVAAFLDNPASLAERLIGALEALGSASNGLRSRATGVEPTFSALLLPSITQLAASAKQPYVLVVDDVQLLTDPDCQAMLAAFAEGVPVGSQVVLLSRTPPPAWVARARAEGRVFELGSQVLAFDDEESRELVTALLPRLPEAQVDDLVQWAEGWPVGLYLVALATQSRGRVSAAELAVGPGRTHRFVVDYLRLEVLAGFEPEARDFMRRTSILDELEGRMCDAVLGSHNSAAVLNGLADRLQLVIGADSGDRRYRYHHLLADALRAELEFEEPWLVPALHLRASEYFQATGDLDAAIRHAKEGGDLGRTGVLVWGGVPACLASGWPDRLGRWLGDLEDRQIRDDRWLCLAAAWLALQTGDPDRMTRWMLAADQHAGPDWTTRAASDEYAASLATIHITAGEGGIRTCLDLCKAAQSGLPPTSGFRTAAILNEGIALALTRRFQEGQARLQRAEQLARALDVPIIEANALAWQGLLAVLADDWAIAAPLFERTADLVALHGLDRLTTSANSVTVVALLLATRGSRRATRGSPEPQQSPRRSHSTGPRWSTSATA